MIVRTTEKYHQDRIADVQATWGSAVRHVFYYSDVNDTAIPTMALDCIRDHWEGLCCKTAKSMEALNAGEAEHHDNLITEATGTLIGCDAIVLAQFTMARARPAVEATATAPVLTSPESAVARLKHLWQTR